MLKKVQYYVQYAQAVTTYIQKVVTLVSSVVKQWPVWIPPVTEENDVKSE